MNYCSKAKELVIKRVIVLGIFILSGIILGVKAQDIAQIKSFITVNSQVVVPNRLFMYLPNENYYAEITPDGHLSQTTLLRRLSETEFEIEKDNIITGRLFIRNMYLGRVAYKDFALNMKYDEGTYFKIDMERKKRDNEDNVAWDYDEIIPRINIVKTEFTQKQISVLEKNDMGGQQSGDIFALTNDNDRYIIYGSYDRSNLKEEIKLLLEKPEDQLNLLGSSQGLVIGKNDKLEKDSGYNRFLLLGGMLCLGAIIIGIIMALKK